MFPPRIVSFPNRTIFGEKSVELFCNISAHPLATVSWFKDGSSLANTTKELHQSGSLACDSNKLVQGFYCVKTSPEILLICNPVHNLHTGQYICQATNRKGSATATAYVDVLGKLQPSSVALRVGGGGRRRVKVYEFLDMLGGKSGAVASLVAPLPPYELTHHCT